VVDEVGPRPHQGVTRAQHGAVRLLALGPVLDR
jgi:hypothetical protein